MFGNKQPDLSEGNVNYASKHAQQIPSGENATNNWAFSNTNLPDQYANSPLLNEQLAVNPLDQMTAIQNFLSIGSVHGRYDDPWLHMFSNTPGMQGETMTPQPMDVDGMMGTGSQTFTPSLYGTGAFLPMNPLGFGSTPGEASQGQGKKNSSE